MEIVKAEILWTRICRLDCAYCAMADGRRNTLSQKEWIRGIDNLKKLGCGFIAFYGAEPLLDDNLKLAEVVGYAESKGIHTTVITSGIVSKLHQKLDILHSKGAKSLSMSYDIVSDDRSSVRKSTGTLDSLQYFQQLGGYRDVAAITTLTRQNFRHFCTSVVRMSRYKVWSFFDMIHWDRGQPGSKCKNFEGIHNLLFQEDDMDDLVEMFHELMKLKGQGHLCHTSQPFIDLITQSGYQHLRQYDWNCAIDDCFPSWVTIDCDGTAYACDDYQPKLLEYDLKIYNLHKNWDRFKYIWKNWIKNDCPGCLWNTHIDAHFIKQGKLPFSDYVHT